ncbi:MAG TPA: acyl-CoA dehydrogenase family protein [Candidatus Dormibacteraeota bacterium]
MGSLREEVRGFLRQEVEKGAFEPHCDAWLSAHDPAFSKRLAERGWVGMTLPSRYGGHERSYLDRYAVLEELLAAGAPVAAHWIADRQTGPLLLRYGTEPQRERFLPAIARGECFFGIGMSEPDSGSDLASIRTSARRVEGGWVLNGAKVWTSHAHRSHYMITLVRTSPLGEDRHQGLSQLIVDLHGPGVEVRPIRLLSGEPHFSEVVFTEAFVPEEMLVGSEGEGWLQVTSELAYERSGPERVLSTFPLLREVVRLAGAGPDARTAQAIGELVARLWTLRRLSMGVAERLQKGDVPAAEAALVKDLGTRFEVEVVGVARDLVAPAGAGDGFQKLYWESVTHAPGFTLRGGTNEILRGIVARSLAASGPLGTDLDEEQRLLAETATDVFSASNPEAEFERAGLAEVREAGPREAALVARIAAYHAAPESLFERLMEPGPLLRAVQMAGAAARARDLTVQYGAERRQFGQPINRFQAVQQEMAEMASEAAAAAAAVDQALEAGSELRVRAAKVAAGRAAARVAAIAHQVHGAIGFTHEHELHRYTTIIWRWRDQDGTEAEHAVELGRAVAGQDLWGLTTA